VRRWKTKKKKKKYPHRYPQLVHSDDRIGMATEHRFRHGGKTYTITIEGARVAASKAGVLPIYRWAVRLNDVDGLFPPVDLFELMTGLRPGSVRCRDLLAKLDGIEVGTREQFEEAENG